MGAALPKDGRRSRTNFPGAIFYTHTDIIILMHALSLAFVRIVRFYTKRELSFTQ